jgi:hypothetical protein
MLKAARALEAAERVPHPAPGGGDAGGGDLNAGDGLGTAGRGAAASGAGASSSAAAGRRAAGDAASARRGGGGGGGGQGGGARGAVPLPVAAAEVALQGLDDWESAVLWGGGDEGPPGQRPPASSGAAAAKQLQQEEEEEEERPAQNGEGAAAINGVVEEGVLMDVDGSSQAEQPQQQQQQQHQQQHQQRLAERQASHQAASTSSAAPALRRLPLPPGAGAAGALGRLGRPRRAANPKALNLHPRMLRLAPQLHLAAAQQKKQKGAKAKDAAGPGGTGAPGQGAPPGAGRGGAAAAAGAKSGPRPPPQLLHAGVLLSQRFRPGLVDDEWADDVIWDAPDANGDGDSWGAAAGAAGGSALQALVAGASAAAAGARRAAPLVWDLNDPGMVFECDRAGAYDEAEALVRAPPPRVSATEWHPLRLAPVGGVHGGRIGSCCGARAGDC